MNPKKESLQRDTLRVLNAFGPVGKSPRLVTCLGVLFSLPLLFSPLAAQTAPVASTAASTNTSGAVQMNPFEVTEEAEDGFRSTSIGSGSRLVLDLKDAPVPYTKIDREFIDALGITDMREAAAWSTGGTFYATDNGGDSRGAGSQYFSRGALTSQGGADGFGAQRNFYQNSSISSDSYAVESYDFGRGPNAALFGQGAGASTQTVSGAGNTNTDIANGGLSGVSSTQTKRARFDRSSTTVALQIGQYNYRRITVDYNRPITERFGVRINAVDLTRDDWRFLDGQTTRGLSLAATYKVSAATELRIDASNEKRTQHTAGPGWYEFVSGWDGNTVFRGPVTNSMRSTTATLGATSVSNGSYGNIQVLGTGPVRNATGLTFNGEDQGVDRMGAMVFYDPYKGTAMNFQNFPMTRRADSTSRVPMWTRTSPNGSYFQRSDTALMPLQGNGQVHPSFGFGLSFYPKKDLPGDVYYRLYENSQMRTKPSQRFSASVDTPLLEQISKDLQFTWTQRLGNNLSFEVGGDANRNVNTNRNLDDSITLGGRTLYLDINTIRPDGSPNSHFLEGYTAIAMDRRLNTTADQTLRANVAYLWDAGKFGNYAFNMQGSLSHRQTTSHNYVMSIKRNADSRLWSAGADQLRIQSYFNDTVRPWTEPATVTFTDVVWDAANNNPVIQAPVTAKPSWVLSSWGNASIRTNYTLLQTTARYFNNRAIFTGAFRADTRSGLQHQSRLAGDLPVGWDATTQFFRDDAPADYFAMTYVQKNTATGLPVTGKPVLALTRPRTTVAGLSVRNPLYANDRFRDDYSSPKSKSSPTTKSLGAVWHVTSWLSTSYNWSDTYTPAISSVLDMTGDVRKSVRAEGTDFSIMLDVKKLGLNLKWNYFDNTRLNDTYNPTVLNNVNTLFQSNKFDDADTTASGRNVRGQADLPGSDYQDKRNFGYEMEMTANIKGIRLSLNGSVSSNSAKNIGELTTSYVPANAELFKQILEDAGGRLDTTQKPLSAPHAPGLAVLNSSITAATTDQQLAVDAYNNIWINYETVAYVSRIMRFPNQPTANFFADYQIQSGRAKGLRVGGGIQWQGPATVATRRLDTILDPNNPIPTAIDDPTRDQFNLVMGTGAYNTQVNLSYPLRLRNGKTLSLALRVNNPINDRSLVIGDNGLGASQGFQGVGNNQPHPTRGLLNPSRQTTGDLVARMTPPINAQLTATYTFGGGRR
jgi:hypothetical protein